MSLNPLVSPATRLEASESKATKRPSPLMAGRALLKFPWLPTLSTLTLVVATAPGSSKIPSASVSRSRTNTSRKPLLSPGTRLEATDSKATKRPSALMAAAPKSPLKLLPCVPALSTLTLSVSPVWRSWTKTSKTPLVSPATRLVAVEAKATKRPSPLMTGRRLALFAWPPRLSTLTLSVVPV